MLRESLRTCQEELARVRPTQEDLLEEVAQERALRLAAEAQCTRLAEAVEKQLLAVPSADSAWRRVRLRARRARLATRDQWRAAEAVAASDLFSASWYIRHHPSVLRSGLPPALHYVVHGARTGNDPSELFSTRRYLQAHPELAETGENPLVHHLRTARGRTP